MVGDRELGDGVGTGAGVGGNVRAGVIGAGVVGAAVVGVGVDGAEVVGAGVVGAALEGAGVVEAGVEGAGLGAVDVWFRAGWKAGGRKLEIIRTDKRRTQVGDEMVAYLSQLWDAQVSLHLTTSSTGVAPGAK